MNLHENKDVFTAAIQLASTPKQEGGLGIKQIYIEKDYWLCRSLKQLSECKESEVAVFKGGTSLSKAYLLGNRFSEDIDIAITSDSQRTDNQTKNIISRISKVMSAGLEEVPNPATRKYSKYRKAFYRYPVTTENEIIGAINPGQILLEIVSFANPYPYQKVFIKSFLTEYLENVGRNDIIEAYGMQGFEIQVLAKSRTATEKLVSLIRHSLSADYISELKAKIRHFYDLHFLWNDPESRAYLECSEFKTDFKELLSSDQARFKEPEGWCDKKVSDSPLISSFDIVWSELQETYSKELPELAYQTIPSPESVAESFKELSVLLI